MEIGDLGARQEVKIPAVRAESKPHRVGNVLPGLKAVERHVLPVVHTIVPPLTSSLSE